MNNNIMKQILPVENNGTKDVSLSIIGKTGNPIDDLHTFAINNYIKKKMNISHNINQNIYEDFSSLFKPFIKIRKGNQIDLSSNVCIFEQIYNVLVNSETNTPIYVNSFAGYGKTEFLSVLYQYLYEKYKNNELKKIPIYVSLHFYNKYIYKNTDDFDKQGSSLLLSHTNELINYLKRNTQKEVVFIIDGTDEFKYPKADFYEPFLSLISNLKIKVNIIGLRKYINKYNSKYRKEFKFTPSPEIVISLGQISVSETNKVNDVVKYFSKLEKQLGNIGPESTNEDLERYINNKIKQLELTNIDFFHLFLFSKGYQDNYQYVTVKSVSRFYHLYLSKCNINFDLAAKLAFKLFNAPDEISNIEKNTKEWWKVQKHESLRNYLTAYYIIQELKKYNDDTDKNIFNFVYPTEINSFCKNIINETPNSRSLYNSIKRLYNKVSITAKTHFCYLLGRFKDDNLKEDIKAFLDEERERLHKEIVKVASPLYQKKLNKDDKKILLYYRTICISLIYLGHKKVNSLYLNLLLSNPYFDNLNRGFHLEYYGDIKFTPKSPSSLNNEDFLGSCENTFQKLYANIRNAIIHRNYYPLFQIELYTLCSLVQHRHAKGKLQRDKRVKILEIISKKDALHKHISKELIFYIDFIAESLSQRGNFCVASLKKLYSLKELYRTGWKERGISPSETVASHVFGALILALFYLPEKMNKKDGYSKSKILRMLLVHDLGEAYIGDIPSKKKTSKDQKKEKEAIYKIDLLKTYNDVSKTINIIEMFEDFSNSNNCTFNAMIARDFDKLDNLFQLYIYKNGIADFENFRDDLIRQIRTGIGKKIATQIDDFFKLNSIPDK